MKKKNRFKAKMPQSGEMSLNITAMADIFTVLLVFLLKGLSSGAVNIQPSAGVQLPSVGAESTFVEALKVEISEKGIQLESKPVVGLENFRLAKGDLEANGISKTLSAAIARERERQMLIAKENTSVKLDSKIVVIADQRAPYSTVKSVLASAAVHGFTDFKLAVFNKNN